MLNYLTTTQRQLLGALVAVAAIAGLLLLTYCTGLDRGKDHEVAEQLAREAELQHNVSAANENASAARVEAAVTAAQQNKELHDALEATDDPDYQRTLRGCIILRQQGRDTNSIPACRGPANGR